MALQPLLKKSPIAIGPNENETRVSGKNPKDRSYFFLEIDMGTETLKRFANKIIAYKEYWKSGKYKEAYGFNHFRVLTLAESEQRLCNLIEVTRKAGGRNMFLFAMFSLIEKALFGQVWFSASSNNPNWLLY